MSINKVFLIYVTTLLSVTLLTLLFVKNIQIKNLKNGIKEIVQNDSVKMETLMDLTLMHGEYISIPLQKEMYVTDSNNLQLSIKDIIKSSKYVYHFDETNCFTCVEMFLPFLKALAKKKGEGNVIILGSYNNNEHLFSTLKRFNLQGISIYNLHPSFLKDTRIGKMNMPFIFEVDSLLRTKMVFIPEKEMPELSLYYLRKLQSLN